MFNRLSKFRKLDEYEDLDGDDQVEMDITDPAMRQHARLEPTGDPEGTGAQPEGGAAEGLYIILTPF